MIPFINPLFNDLEHHEYYRKGSQIYIDGVYMTGECYKHLHCTAYLILYFGDTCFIIPECDFPCSKVIYVDRSDIEKVMENLHNELYTVQDENGVSIYKRFVKNGKVGEDLLICTYSVDENRITVKGRRSLPHTYVWMDGKLYDTTYGLKDYEVVIKEITDI